VRTLALPLLLALATPRAVVGQLGELPAGAASTGSIRDVRVELGLESWIDPDQHAARIPTGIRLQTAAAVGVSDSIAPAQWAASLLLILGADRIEADGRLASSGEHGATEAQWWLNTIDEAPVEDPRARGAQQAVELTQWITDRELLVSRRELGLPVEPGDVGATPSGDGWHFWLRTDDVSLDGGCRPEGDPVVVDYPLPAYSTIWSGESTPRTFTVYTYEGHRAQPCLVMKLDVLGDGDVARAGGTSMTFSRPLVILMSGWQARWAVYSRGRE